MRDKRRDMLITQDRSVHLDNLIPILAEHLDRERFLAFEVIVERSLGHTGRSGYFLNAGRVEASAADEIAALFKEFRAGFWVGGSGHEI